MKKKVAKSINALDFKDAIDNLPLDEKLFIDRSMEIANYIFELMQQNGILQKDLAMRMEKTEAEISRLLSGFHNYTLRSLTKVEAALGCQVIYVPKTAATPMTYHKFSSTCIKKDDCKQDDEVKESAMNYAA